MGKGPVCWWIVGFEVDISKDEKPFSEKFRFFSKVFCRMDIDTS